MKKQLICICMAALLSLSLLTGCGAGTDTGDTAGTEAKNVTVRLSEVTHSVFYAPQYVAMSQGFFADEGLDIELSNGGGADKVMTAVVSGGADIGLTDEQLAGQYEGKAEIGKVDVDEQGELAMRYGVMSIPTVIFFKNGKEIDRKVGVMPAGAFTQVLDQNL